MARLERITTDPDVCHGQPTIRGLRYPVESLLELLASGMTIEQIIQTSNATICLPLWSSGR
jgi:uncharacterized protein (DUF433 family)